MRGCLGMCMWIWWGTLLLVVGEQWAGGGGAAAGVSQKRKRICESWSRKGEASENANNIETCTKKTES